MPPGPRGRPKFPQEISSDYLLQPRQERIREREEQRETDTDHGNRVDERGDNEHLGLQHRRQLRLTRRTFEKAATENAETDGGAQRTHAEDDSDGQHGHGLDMCNVFHFKPPEKTLTRRTSDARAPSPGRRW